MNFGEKVRQSREAMGITQKELAKQTGISLRTIINYENGDRMPKQRASYTKLADVFEVAEEALMDDNAEFVVKASEYYGKRGYRQAMKLVEEVKGLYAGGELEDEDMDAMMRAIQDAYWIAKENNRKYTPKKYRKRKNDDSSR